MVARKKIVFLRTKKNTTPHTKQNTIPHTTHHTKHNTKHHTNHLHHIKKKLHDEQIHKYTKYYPSIIDPNFSHKIATHKIFKKYKQKTNINKLSALYESFKENKPQDSDKKKASDKSSGYILKLKPVQKLLRNFMSPYSPYRGLLIYHEMGVGKTCTAITIAEALKSIVVNSNTKIYVINPAEIERQIFDINVVQDKTPLYQCTGNTYLQTSVAAASSESSESSDTLIENCGKGNMSSCDTIKHNAEKEISKIYEFTGPIKWANAIDKEIKMKTKGKEYESNPKAKQDKIRQIISNKFDNSIIIIDEAHDLNDSKSNSKSKSDSNGGSNQKIVPPKLNMVLEYASNVRLIFLTATPIYDKPFNIISIMNYFLKNDKRKPLRQNDVFDKEGNLKPNGRHILEEKTRGYISYLRGNNPYEFPIRLSAKYNIPDSIFNLSKYPKKNFQGKRIDSKDRIQLLELIDCPLQKVQLDILNYHIKNSKIPDINEENLEDYTENDPSFEDPLTDSDIATIEEAIDFEKKKDKDEDSEAENKTKADEEVNSNTASNTASNNTDDDMPRTKAVAYLLERQLSNFAYQTLEEANKNVKLTAGINGLNQVANKQYGKWTYEFKKAEYGKRFLLPELKNWGAKIAKIVERAIASNGPIFVYSYFKEAGIIPLAFALEMNGFHRYKQRNTPLIENAYKDNKVSRGDYIIYTGTQSQSLFADYYLNKRSKMINETSVKVFIGTSKASEGLNLFGYREVHILDPWHNINLIEQSIGRVIRTGSHLHLPPQERNVSVYQYATTMGDTESFDLKIYKICESKAIKAGVVEKILKENAFDCELNKEVNFYDVKTYGNKIPLITSNNKAISVSLADAEYSRSCFYMKECNFKCTGEVGLNAESHYNAESHSNSELEFNMKFNYEKDVEEFKNLIIQLMKSSFNIKIENLRNYLKNLNTGKTSPYFNINVDIDIDKGKDKDVANWEDEEAFNSAIQDIINTDKLYTDKYERKGKIMLSGPYLRFIPEGNLEPNMSIQKQYVKTPHLFSQIDLKAYISSVDDKQKNLMEFEQRNYNDIFSKSLIEKSEQIFHGLSDKEYSFNVKLKFEEILELVFTKLFYSFKLIIIKTLLEKIIKKEKLSDNELKLEKIIKKHIVFMKDIYPETVKKEGKIKSDSDSNSKSKSYNDMYGFIIQNDNNKLEVYHKTQINTFEKTLGNLKKIIEYHKNRMNKTPNAKLYGFLIYDKENTEPMFKITDIDVKGEKKSVRGLTCKFKSSSEVKKTLDKLDNKILRFGGIKYHTKPAFCNDVEILMRRYDAIGKDGKKWFYTPEEQYIMFEAGII